MTEYHTYWTCPNCGRQVGNGAYHYCTTAVPNNPYPYYQSPYNDIVLMQRLAEIEEKIEEILKLLKKDGEE